MRAEGVGIISHQRYYTRRMFNIIGERERPNLSCQPSYCTIEVKKAHPGPKAMRITVFEGLTSRDSCRMQPQGLCLNSYYCRGGMGLCMPIEVISFCTGV